MPSFGIVQGRLTPSTQLQAFPEDYMGEFEKAFDLGFDYIELIADRDYNEKNPLWQYRKPFPYACPIVCNDYIINHRMDRLQSYRLIDQCEWFQTRMIVLPLMGKSEGYEQNCLLDIANYAASKNIRIGLETVMNYQTQGIPNASIVYDTGNRSFVKSDMPGDIKRLKDIIGHVHIKDKNDEGENVLLGCC